MENSLRYVLVTARSPRHVNKLASQPSVHASYLHVAQPLGHR